MSGLQERALMPAFNTSGVSSEGSSNAEKQLEGEGGRGKPERLGTITAAHMT